MPSFVLHPDHPTGEFRRTVEVRGERRLLKFTAGVPLDVTNAEAAGLARDLERGYLLRDGEKPKAIAKPEPPRLDVSEDPRDPETFDLLETASRRSWWPITLNWSQWRR